MTHEDNTLEIMTGGMRLAIEDSVRNIERITLFFDSRFEGLDASKLPEYQRAIDAIREYQSVLIERFTKKYNESVS